MIIDLTRLLARRTRTLATRQADGHADSGVPVGQSEDSELVRWPALTAQRAGHVLVLGATGSGKSVLAAHALARQVAADGDTAPAIVLVDCKGDLASYLVAAVSHLAPDRLAQLHVLNPFSDAGFAFDLTRLPLFSTPVSIRALQIAELVALTSTAHGQQRHLGVGARQVELLHHLVLAVLTARDRRAHLGWALEALHLPNGLARLATRTRHEGARQALSGTRLGEELRASTASRLRLALAATDGIYHAVTAGSCVNFDTLTGAGAITIVNVGSPPGGLVAAQTFWANAVTRLIAEHLLMRPSPYHGHGVLLVVDEAQVVTAVLQDIAERLVTVGRSKKLALSLLTQTMALIERDAPALIDVLLGNVTAVFAGRLNVRDAAILARAQAPAEGVEQTIADLRGEVTVALANLAPQAFFSFGQRARTRFVTERVDLAAWEAAAVVHQAAIARARARYALPERARPLLSLSDVAPDRAPRQRSSRRPRSPWG